MTAMHVGAILEGWRPGSAPDHWAWDWEREREDLYTRICACCERPGHYQRQLVEYMRGNDMPIFTMEENDHPEEISLGSDGRVWNGHHRILAASELGIESIPVRLCEVG